MCQWMRDQAQAKIGHLYPTVTLPKEQGGGQATVIAWLWARTVTCPNPACRAKMPLVRSFDLSKKRGKAAWVEPVVDRATTPASVHFTVKTGSGRARDVHLLRRKRPLPPCALGRASRAHGRANDGDCGLRGQVGEPTLRPTNSVFG
jgi:putative DNA methylase